MINPKPTACLFCGRRPAIAQWYKDGRILYQAQCQGYMCEFHTRWLPTRSEAIAEWNRRCE
jgi:hypothetical protein